MTITPNEIFEIVRPDEVAECWDGVLDMGLYQPLWDCVPEYTGPSPEESEEPCHGMNCVADFWDRFDRGQQIALNELAEREDAQD